MKDFFIKLYGKGELMPLITNLRSDFRLRVSFPVFEKFPISTIIILFGRVLDFLGFLFALIVIARVQNLAGEVLGKVCSFQLLLPAVRKIQSQERTTFPEISRNSRRLGITLDFY